MERDIRDLLKCDDTLSNGKMPEGHEERFAAKLDASYNYIEPQNRKSHYLFFKIAATVVVMLGLGYAIFQTMDADKPATSRPSQEIAQLKTLGDVSPNLKKVEDYYIANINLELAEMEINDDNKELFDGYILKLEELNNEYKRLSEELTNNGPNELTVSALIDNLKLRLNLLYRLKQQLQDLSEDELPNKSI